MYTVLPLISRLQLFKARTHDLLHLFTVGGVKALFGEQAHFIDAGSAFRVGLAHGKLDMGVMVVDVLFVVSHVVNRFLVGGLVVILELLLTDASRGRRSIRPVFRLRHSLPRDRGVPCEFHETVPHGHRVQMLQS